MSAIERAIDYPVPLAGVKKRDVYTYLLGKYEDRERCSLF